MSNLLILTHLFAKRSHCSQWPLRKFLTFKFNIPHLYTVSVAYCLDPPSLHLLEPSGFPNEMFAPSRRVACRPPLSRLLAISRTLPLPSCRLQFCRCGLCQSSEDGCLSRAPHVCFEIASANASITPLRDHRTSPQDLWPKWGTSRFLRHLRCRLNGVQSGTAPIGPSQFDA